MNTAHDLMERLQGEGAARFADTGLAQDHTHVVRRVRRDRAVRASVLSVAGIVVAGAAVVGATQLTAGPVPPATSPTAPTEPPSPSAAPANVETVSVAKQERIEYIADDLAAVFGVTRQEAMDALIAALPAEADGNPEGWVVAGEYSFDGNDDLQAAAESLVSTMTGHLESLNVPREDWLDTVILASILQQEAPTGLADQAVVARVLLNRLELEMPLQIESPLAYDLRADERPVGDDGWAVDTPYNTFMYAGLPPSAIGTPTTEAVEAAANPANGDWMFYLRKDDGNVTPYVTYEEFAAAVDEYRPGTGASD